MGSSFQVTDVDMDRYRFDQYKPFDETLAY